VTAHTPQERSALDALRTWDDNTSKTSVAATVYEVWLYRLPQALIGDKVRNDEIVYDYQANFTFTSQFLAHAFATGSSPWCAPAGGGSQSCAPIAERTFEAAVSEVKGLLGDDVSKWQWGSIHHAHFWHVPFYRVPPLKPFFDREAPNGGDWSTIDVGAYFRTSPTEKLDSALHVQLNEFGPSYRQVIDLGNLDDSRFIESIGQSGHFLSSHYDEYLSDWLAGRYRAMRFDRSDVMAGPRLTMTLNPAKQ
jgi:penicillin amidase